jgi:hypothetical protein
MRWRLPRLERSRQRALVEAFETTKKLAIDNEDGRFQGIYALANIGLYFLIAHRDIQAVKIDALTHPDEWSRKLNARVILLTIYEWDASKASGRSLQKSFEHMGIPDGLRREAIESLRKLRKIQERVNAKFSLVRNAAIAHRDPNALIQYRAIRDMDVNAVWKMSGEFFAEAENFLMVLARLMSASQTLPSYLKQWSVSAPDTAHKR